MASSHSATYIGSLEVLHDRTRGLITDQYMDNDSVFALSVIGCPIRVGETIIVGRLQDRRPVLGILDVYAMSANLRSTLCFADPTVSNTHLKVYSIEYDDVNSIPPLVYAEDLSSNGTFWNNKYMGRGHGAVLLSDGDTLKISERVTLIYRGSPMEELWSLFSEDQIAEIKTFESLYTITTKQLGKGGFGTVVLATKTSTGKQLACKVVDIASTRDREINKVDLFLRKRRQKEKDDVSPNAEKELRERHVQKAINEHVTRVYREVDILQQVNHPNIVRLEKVYHSSDALYIFQELVTGGDLMSYINDSGGRLGEADAAAITRQVLEAVKYLHDRNIAHRDIKPENILLSNRCGTPRAMLSDFGHAAMLSRTGNEGLKRMSTLAGTYGYSAPEIFLNKPDNATRNYTKAVDMWSLGCLAYTMLVGQTPFSFEDSQRTPADISQDGSAVDENDNSPEAGSIWYGVQVSSRAKSFIRQLLVVNEACRMTADQALDHSWFTNSKLRESFNTVYCKAIATWRPKSASKYIVEKLILPKSMMHRGRWMSKHSSKDGERGRSRERNSRKSRDRLPNKVDQQPEQPTMQSAKEETQAKLRRAKLWGKLSVNNVEKLNPLEKLNLISGLSKSRPICQLSPPRPSRGLSVDAHGSFPQSSAGDLETILDVPLDPEKCVQLDADLGIDILPPNEQVNANFSKPQSNSPAVSKILISSRKPAEPPGQDVPTFLLSSKFATRSADAEDHTEANWLSRTRPREELKVPLDMKRKATAETERPLDLDVALHRSKRLRKFLSGA